jgi:hypothetical protein
MNLQVFFKKVRAELQKRNISYAMAGGFVASVYRKEPRATEDLDFFFLAKTYEDGVATELIDFFGLKTHIVRKADLEGGPVFAIKNKNTPINMVVGRSNEKPGLDLILSNIKWSEGIMERAQANKVDFGFGPIPCLTVEDILIAKFYSFANNKTLFKDLDDIQSIFQADNDLDYDYILGRLHELNLWIPKEVVQSTPRELKSKLKR